MGDEGKEIRKRVVSDQSKLDSGVGVIAKIAAGLAGLADPVTGILGPIILAILSDVSGGKRQKRYEDRIAELIESLGSRITSIESEAEAYIKTDDFHELLENAFINAAREHNPEKREIYADFVSAVIASPNQDYDDLIQALEEIRQTHSRDLDSIRKKVSEIEQGSVGENVSESDVDRERREELALTDQMARFLDRNYRGFFPPEGAQTAPPMNSTRRREIDRILDTSSPVFRLRLEDAINPLTSLRNSGDHYDIHLLEGYFQSIDGLKSLRNELSSMAPLNDNTVLKSIRDLRNVILMFGRLIEPYDRGPNWNDSEKQIENCIEKADAAIRTELREIVDGVFGPLKLDDRKTNREIIIMLGKILGELDELEKSSEKVFAERL